jgi:hypothetical protein
MTNNPNQHDIDDSTVEAFNIFRGNRHVATIGLRSSTNGEEGSHARVRWIGLEMVRGYAGGGGYDNRTAAVAAAVRTMKLVTPGGLTPPYDLALFHAALTADDGRAWSNALKAAGFTVIQAA